MGDYQGTPPQQPGPERFRLRCDGCGLQWWNDEDCTCTCRPGDENYEEWSLVDKEFEMNRVRDRDE